MALISVLYQNVRGLRTKLIDFKQNVSVSNVEILCISESCLNSNILYSEVLAVNEYSVFRRDRESTINIYKS